MPYYGMAILAIAFTFSGLLAQSPSLSKRQQKQRVIQSVYSGEMANEGRDCAGILQQQPANICMGKVELQTERNFNSFLDQLRVLISSGDDLVRLNQAEITWETYRTQTCDAVRHHLGGGGTETPYLESSCVIGLTRNRMKDLYHNYETEIRR
jgi:uncharacterized protein YecT (DUF1311 family)